MRMHHSVIPALVFSLALGACSTGRKAEAGPTSTLPQPTTTTAVPTTTTTAPAVHVSSLTGLPLADEWVKARPVVAVKFDNVQGRSTPQAGINAADVVYEIQVEGQITRLLALYQSTDAAAVGPVRSARGSEVAILEELNQPLFTWHGANDILAAVVAAADVIPRSVDDIPGLFYRQVGRPAPYNSFVRGTAEIRATAPDGVTGPPDPIFAFADEGEAPSPVAVPATHVRIRFPPPFGQRGVEAPVDYKWDGAKWRRDQHGRLHVDTDGRQVAVDNVIVRFTRALDSGTVDRSGTIAPTAEVVGEGEAWVFTAGTVTTGTWHKETNRDRTRYLDHHGDEIRLTPGTTWVSMPYGKGSSFFE